MDPNSSNANYIKIIKNKQKYTKTAKQRSQLLAEVIQALLV